GRVETGRDCTRGVPYLSHDRWRRQVKREHGGHRCHSPFSVLRSSFIILFPVSPLLPGVLTFCAPKLPSRPISSLFHFLCPVASRNGHLRRGFLGGRKPARESSRWRHAAATRKYPTPRCGSDLIGCVVDRTS